MLFVLPWTYLLIHRKIRLWPILVGFAVPAAVSYLAQEATIQFNLMKLNSGTAGGIPFLLPPFRMQEYAAFSVTATVVAALNFLMLRRLGIRFQMAKTNSLAPARARPVAA